MHAIKSLCVLICLAALCVPAHARAQRVGGPCAYKDHPGTATFVSVAPLPPSHGSARRGYRVLFTFATDVNVASPLYRVGQVREFTLVGGVAPGQRYVEKYGIRQGRTVRGVMRVITAGTCTPVLFKLEGIDEADLFELKTP
uniref:Uncharacterized protein n=1 Tax=Fundidesulfovibrio putealis TaxID=270496 RepID=A0A7C4A8B5_9BACT